MRHILFNLISNASKYSDVKKNIYITCTSDDGKVHFSVRDEGIGISAEDQKHLFERFFRAGNAGNIPGTGLGLNIVRRYVDLLEGTISFSSEYGKGSTFVFSLPLKN
jgi:signal transduction histidine kinase